MLSACALQASKVESLLVPAASCCSLTTVLHALQMWTASQDAGNIGHMVRARLDVPRFVKLNTVKGRWALLDDIDTEPVQRQPPGLPAARAVAQQASQKAAIARPALQKDAVVRIVREVAAGIVSATDLEGAAAQELSLSKGSHRARKGIKHVDQYDTMPTVAVCLMWHF